MEKGAVSSMARKGGGVALSLVLAIGLMPAVPAVALADETPAQAQEGVAENKTIHVSEGMQNVVETIENAEDGSTIVLDADITIDNPINLYGKEGITIDGGSGHTISVGSDFAADETGHGSALKIDNCKDVKINNVLLKMGEVKTPESIKSGHALDVWESSGVTLTNVTLDHSQSNVVGAPLVVTKSKVMLEGVIEMTTGEKSWYAANVDDKMTSSTSLTAGEGANVVLTGDMSKASIKVENVSDGFVPVELGDEYITDGNGNYAVPVATANGESFITVEAAINAVAASGGVVEIVNDAAFNGITIPDGVAVNGNSHSLYLVGDAENPVGSAIILTGADSSISDVVVNAGDRAKHGIQLYNSKGSRVENVTVNGGAWTSILVNAAIEAEIKDCTLVPEVGAYANIEYGMGTMATAVPTMTVSGLSFREGFAQIWVDYSTYDKVAAYYSIYEPGLSQDGVFSKIVGNVKNEGTSDIEITVQTVQDSEGTVIETEAPRFKVTFDDNNEATEDKPVEVIKGNMVPKPADPTKQGYVFGGWFSDEECTISFDFLTPITADTIVYAMWKESPAIEESYDVVVPAMENGAVTVDPKEAKEGEKVTVTVKPDAGFELASLVVADEDGNALKLELNADGTYSFEMPAGDVTVHAVFECDSGELCPSHGFTDVDQSQWYHAAIDWAVDNDVLQGVGDGLMLPDGDITRAQMAQVLWNVEGQPAAAEGEGFSDVSEGDWFAGAVAWASQEGIFVGYDGAFDPDAELTREQAATVLMRWAESNGEDVSGRADLSGFPDADGVSEWAVESVRWAVDAGVLEGVANPDGTTTVSAQGTATRAQVAALMMRLEGQRTA